MHNLSCSTKCVPYALVIVSSAMLAAAGCATTKGLAVDGHSRPLSITTASADAVRAANVSRKSNPEPRGTRFHASPKSGSVTHTPVYFRSNTENPAGNDRRDDLSGADYLEWISETARFLISIASHPVDVLITPPWTLMESDGKHVRRAALGDRKKHGSG